MELWALMISILAFLLSVFQFVRNSSRQKKEATLIAYGDLQKEVFSILNKYPDDLSKIEHMSDEWEEITICLARIENFSVGINTNIYSFKILNRLGGAFFIRQFKRLKPVIDLKRQKNVSSGNHYNEFESTVIKLKEHRQQARGER